MIDLVALGAAIKHWRTAAGLSQQELADNAGVHRTYVSDIENGRRNVTLDILDRISTGLGVELSRLTATAELLASRKRTTAEASKQRRRRQPEPSR